MKAISIRQPWAYAIARLGKREENRDWAGCAYRGPVLLHASKTLKLGDFDEDVESIRGIITRQQGHEAGMLRQPPGDLAVWSTARNVPGWRPAPSLPLGGIVGRAQIVDVMRRSTEARPAELPWYGGGFALVLADVEPLEFYPYKGALGLFDVPDNLDLRRAA